MRRVLLIFCLLFSIQSFGFPQMIRHGYNNCNTCHASPRGGGMLTDYGRALSKELLSTWSFEGEEQWDYGAIKDKPSWLKIGGDFRSAQVHVGNQRGTMGRFIRMQEQVEGALKYKSTWLNITGSSDTLKESRPWSVTQFYLYTQLTDHLNLRVGRFVPRFGVNVPEHIFSTRGDLGFGYQSERDTFEMMYIKENWDISMSIVSGKLKNKQEASGFYSQANYSFTSKDKIGISFEKKTKESEDLSVGIHGLVGLTESLYFVTDSVYRKNSPQALSEEEGFFHFSKLGWEMEKGFHFIAIEDLKKSNLSQSSSTEFLYGLGFSFFPRPHFEFQGVLAKQKNLSFGTDEGEYAWLMMHFYL